MHWPGIEPGSPAWEARILPLNHQCPARLTSWRLSGKNLQSDCDTLGGQTKEIPKKAYTAVFGRQEFTDWQALEAKACQEGLQSGNSIKWEHSNENIKIPALSAHTTTLRKALYDLTTDPCRRYIGNPSRSLVYDPQPQTLQTLTLEGLRKLFNLLG